MFQVQFIVIIIFLAIFDLIYRILDKKNKSYNYSLIYLRIEKIYKKWYAKNINTVNSSRASAVKIREIIFTLVKELRKDGIKQKDIDSYYSLITAVPKKNKFYKIVIGLLTAVGGSELAKPIFQSITKLFYINTFTNWFILSYDLLVCEIYVYFINE